MIIRKAALDIVCGVTSRLPKTGQPEIAFAGRSNVGKSSLINCLMNRKSLARTSSKPGKTQTINFYHINEELYLVDLPGYGYAAANLQARSQWGKMIEEYLHRSEDLKAVFLLVDIRHNPTENDRLMYSWIVSNNYKPIIIATKLDKIKRSQLGKQLAAVRKGLNLDKETVLIPFSSETRQGRDEIWKTIQEAIGKDSAGEDEEAK